MITLGKRYRCERVLGEGGMAVVYLARDLKHDRPVAVKTLRPELAAAVGAERFLREMHIIAQLSHPHILPLIDSGEAEGGVLYYVMPHVAGGALRDLLRQVGALPIDQAVRLAGEIADALGHAHDAGIVHRDIKPENVLLQSGHAVVSDFGIARALTESPTGEQSALTRTGVVLGTPAYMSPEQLLGDKLDARTDIYSLACVLYEMLTGQPPFSAASAQEIVANHVTQAPRSPTDLRPDVPPSVANAVLAALAKSADERLPTAAAFGAAITGEMTRPTRAPSRRRLYRRVAAGVLLAAAVVGIAMVKARASSVSSLRSVAVMPFVTQSRSEDDEYLATGMTDVLINSLAAVPGLRVPSRTSVYAMADPRLGSPRMASRLGVDALIEGSVQRTDSLLSVAIRLIDGRRDSVLWSTTLRGNERQLFQLEEDLVRAVAGGLRRRSASASPRRGTESIEAYEAYTRGRHLWNERGARPGMLHRAEQYFEEAIRLDSGYARAWAGLADVYSMRGGFGDAPAGESFPLARTAARRALELDSSLAEAHTSMAIVSTFYDWDWNTAEKEFASALALDSTDARAYLFRTWYYVATGQFANALESILTAQRLDPTSPTIAARVGSLYLYLRRPADAERAIRTALDLDSSNVAARVEWMRWLVLQGRAREVLTIPSPPDMQFGYGGMVTMAVAYAAVGERDRARAVEQRMQRDARQRYVTPEALAIAALAVGDTAGALTQFERGLKERSFFMILTGVEPFNASLNGNPRFERLLASMRLAHFDDRQWKR